MTEKLHEWQQEFQLKNELTQSDFEEIESALLSLPQTILMRKVNSSISSGAMLRAAIKAKWIVVPECKTYIDEETKERMWMYAGKDVSKMHPAAVSWLGRKVDAKYNEIINQSPKNL